MDKNQFSLKNVLVIDIETVAQSGKYEAMPERMKELWAKKHQTLRIEDNTPEQSYEERAGIYAEFGKIIVIGIGAFYEEVKQQHVKVKSIQGHDEKEILIEFASVLEKLGPTGRLVAHNGKEFDFPYICRRYLINNLPIPYLLNYSGAKPWEVPHLDTMEMWKFGDWKSYTSLDLLAAVFGIESSKGDIDGSQVGKTYYEEKNLQKIADYCKRDVIVTAQLLLKLKNIPLIIPENIIHA